MRQSFTPTFLFFFFWLPPHHHQTRDSVTALLLHVYCILYVAAAVVALWPSSSTTHKHTLVYSKYPWRMCGKPHKGNNRLGQSIRCVCVYYRGETLMKNFFILCVQSTRWFLITLLLPHREPRYYIKYQAVVFVFIISWWKSAQFAIPIHQTA